MIIIFLLIFLLGASLGSFAGMLATRTAPDNQKISSLPPTILGRSQCDNCGHTLEILDLIPIFSSLFLKIKCRYCGKKLDLSYTILEIITGIWALIVSIEYFYHDNNFIKWILFFLIGFFFIYIAFYDYKYLEVQTTLVEIFSVIVLLIFIVNQFTKIYNSELLTNILGAVVGWVLIAGIILATKGKGMGWGDAWVFGLVGLSVGFYDMFNVMLIAIFSGALIGLIKAILIDKKIHGVTIPFVPFISFGVLVTLLINIDIWRLLIR